MQHCIDQIKENRATMTYYSLTFISAHKDIEPSTSNSKIFDNALHKIYFFNTLDPWLSSIWTIWK